VARDEQSIMSGRWWSVVRKKYPNRIGSVMVIVLASSVVDRGFEFRSRQTIDYKTGIC
jgi:hypothetical protein